MNKLILIIILILTSCTTSQKLSPSDQYIQNRNEINDLLLEISMELEQVIKTDEIKHGWVKESDSFSRSRFDYDISESWYLDGIKYYQKKIKWLTENNFSYSQELIKIYKKVILEIKMGERYDIHRFIYK